MKNFINYIKQVLIYTATNFTMSMTACLAVWFFFGWEAMQTSTVFSLLLVCLFMSFMQSIAFTELWFKKMHYSLRIIIFAIPSLVFMILIAWKFQWFPMKQLGNWLLFAGIFMACLIISSIIYEIYFRITGNKYDGLLGEYHKKREMEK